MIKTIVRALLALTRTEYGCFKIFRSDLASFERPRPRFPPGYSVSQVTGAEVERARDKEMARQAGFDGRDSLGFAVFHDREIVSLGWIWHGARYREERNFWPLGPREAKVVQSFTIPSERGRGLSALLMQHCNQELKVRGFERVYTRIWWNHHASLRSAEKLGRKHIATMLELRLFGAKRPLRFVKRVNTLDSVQ